MTHVHALEVIFYNNMRYINLRFTYCFTLLTPFGKRNIPIGLHYGYGTIEKLTLTAADRHINVLFMNISQSSNEMRNSVIMFARCRGCNSHLMQSVILLFRLIFTPAE